MNSKDPLIEKIKQHAILALFYHDDETVCMQTTQALYRAGIRCIEFTNRGQNALPIFKKLIAERNISMPDLLLAIGTIHTKTQAESFIAAGADFLISPFFDEGVCEVAYGKNILWIPGCMTPTEIHIAQVAGCNMVKLFPGNLLGPGFVEAIRPLFTGICFLVTGGVDVTADNLTAWFNSGVTGVGMGSKLITTSLLKNGDYKLLQTKTEEVISIIKKIKNSRQ